jgi:hypothetical protein
LYLLIRELVEGVLLASITLRAHVNLVNVTHGAQSQCSVTALVNVPVSLLYKLSSVMNANLASITSSLEVVIIVTVTNGVLLTMIQYVTLLPGNVTVKLARIRSAPGLVTGVHQAITLMSTTLYNASPVTATPMVLLTVVVTCTLDHVNVVPMSRETSVMSARKGSTASIL